MKNGTYEKVKGWIESDSIREMIETSLGTTAEVDAWTTAALASIGTDKDVLRATPESILGAFLEAASLGLRFEGPLGEAYIATRNRKTKNANNQWIWITEVQLQVGYRGLMKLARRDPRVRKVEAIIVHENDVFDHRLGSDSFLHHTWDVRKTRGKMVAAYAAVRYHDGFYDFGQPYSMDAVLRHRERILADKDIRIAIEKDGSETFYKTWDGKESVMNASAVRRIPWITYLEAMTQKTAVRWSSKFWDLTPDFDRAAALISIDEAGRSQKLEDVARSLVSSEILDRPQDTGDEGGTSSGNVSTSQGPSLTRMGSLRDQMLRESGISQGSNEGPPPEQTTGNDTMTDEEKQEALQAERDSEEDFNRGEQENIQEADAIISNSKKPASKKPARGGRKAQGK